MRLYNKCLAKFRSNDSLLYICLLSTEFVSVHTNIILLFHATFPFPKLPANIIATDNLRYAQSIIVQLNFRQRACAPNFWPHLMSAPYYILGRTDAQKRTVPEHQRRTAVCYSTCSISSQWL